MELRWVRNASQTSRRKQVWRRAWLVLTLAAATVSFGTQCALTVVSLT
jgi:hypothetical protein